MTATASQIAEPPTEPGVYAMYGGLPPRVWVAYVGTANNIRRRMVEHFVNRDSSVATGTSATGLNVDQVRYVEWWEDPAFADKEVRGAAELVAFDTLEPSLRSRANPSTAARKHYDDPAFQRKMEELFASSPTGRYVLPSLNELADRIAQLEARFDQLERLVRERLE